MVWKQGRTLAIIFLYPWVVSSSQRENHHHDHGDVDVDTEEMVVNVEFYGESQCNGCRRFVTDVWPTIWNDNELMEYVQYDFIAWGNSYFQLEECKKKKQEDGNDNDIDGNDGYDSTAGDDTYDAKERACWYEHCSTLSTKVSSSSTIFLRQDRRRGQESTTTTSDCFSGKVIYQHSEKEGQIDVYENCIKYHFGIEKAVNFTYCAEGDMMDTHDSASDVLFACLGESTLEAMMVQECYDTHRHTMEIMAAMMTPAHSGVPYVVVDGEALDDPFSIQQAICDRLKKKFNILMKYDETKKEETLPRLPIVCQELDMDERSYGIDTKNELVPSSKIC